MHSSFPCRSNVPHVGVKLICCCFGHLGNILGILNHILSSKEIDLFESAQSLFEIIWSFYMLYWASSSDSTNTESVYFMRHEAILS
jgi:hypothetical protein